MAKKKKQSKSNLQKKTTASNSSANKKKTILKENELEKKDSSTLSEYKESTCPMKIIPNDTIFEDYTEIGDNPNDYTVSVAVTIPNLVSNIKYSTSKIATTPQITLENSKHWVFIVSHNYTDDNKTLSDPEYFIQMSYRSNKSIPDSRYVILKVIFDNDNAQHSHTYTSFPIYFDGIVNTYNFGNVVSLCDILDTKHGLLKDGTLSFIIRVYPAPLGELSIETKFLLAVRKDDTELMQRYFDEGCDLDCTSDFFSLCENSYLDEATGLIIAANDHCNKALLFLLQNGCDILRVNHNGDNAVMRACWSGNKEGLIELIKSGASLDCENYNGSTPLIYASLMNNVSIVSSLLESKIDINHQDYEGNTACHYAALYGNDKILSLLLKYKALLNIKNNNGEYAIDAACDADTKRMIISSDRVSVLSNPQAPYICSKPFQLPTKSLQDLFSIGIIIMKYVAANIVSFPIYPFDLLTQTEKYVLIQREYDNITQNRSERMELNILTESLYFACFYVLTKGLICDHECLKVKEPERNLRLLIIQAYEDIYHERLNEKGITSQQTSSSVFVSILDLILLYLIDHYDIKQNLFLNCVQTVIIHNSDIHYKELSLLYFITLPMTKSDESYLHLFETKRQTLFNQNDCNYKDIIVFILSALSPRQEITKSILTTPITIDYIAIHAQLKLLNDRCISSYSLIDDPDYHSTSKTYGNQGIPAMQILSNEFKQYWKTLSVSEKQAILSIQIKDLENEIKESIYWFILRYVILNWDICASHDEIAYVTKNNAQFIFNHGELTEETLTSMSTGAKLYDYCVQPCKDLQNCHLFCEPYTLDVTKGDMPPFCFPTLRFKTFLYWAFCNQLCNAFLLKLREAEADRMAVMLMNEVMIQDEGKGKAKKKKRRNKGKKKEEDKQGMDSSQPQSQLQSQSQLQQVQNAKNTKKIIELNEGMKGTKGTKIVKNQEIKEETTINGGQNRNSADNWNDKNMSQLCSQYIKSAPSSLLVLLDLNNKITPIKEEEKFHDVEISEANKRVIQFLQGENREKSDNGPINTDRKHVDEEHEETVFISLDSLMKTKLDPEVIEEPKEEIKLSEDEINFYEREYSILPSLKLTATPPVMPQPPFCNEMNYGFVPPPEGFEVPNDVYRTPYVVNPYYRPNDGMNPPVVLMPPNRNIGIRYSSPYMVYNDPNSNGMSNFPNEPFSMQGVGSEQAAAMNPLQARLSTPMARYPMEMMNPSNT